MDKEYNNNGDYMVILCNKVLWAIATSLILMCGIFFTYKFKFVQFRLKDIYRSFSSKNSKEKGISPISSLMMVLAGRIGVGSIAGVALAIYLGGIGSIFWMWIIAFIAASSTFAETVLGIKYHEKDHGNIYKGGPAYYIKHGLGLPKLGGAFAILVIISYIGGFLGIQSNTIVKSIESIVSVPPLLVAFIICFLTAIIIFGGVEKISAVTSKLVPIMTIIYVLTALFICMKQIDMMPTILVSIIKEAFNFKSFFAGFLTTFIVGIQRGIFSNEAGLGTGSIASSTTDDDDPVKNGYIQLTGIYITTLLICTATAFIILTSDYASLTFSDINGIEITQYAFTYHLGNTGNIIVFLSIVLFSFSTILTGYYYGESCLKYFSKVIKKEYLLILKLCTIVILFLGALLSAQFLWNIVDLFVALLAIINMMVLYKLYPVVLLELRKKRNSSIKTR